MFGTILFPNVDELVDLVAIDAFLAYHHSKESPIIVVLAYAYDTFDLRCEKSNARIFCCTPALYVWLVSHVFNHESRFVCPLQGHRMFARMEILMTNTSTPYYRRNMMNESGHGYAMHDKRIYQTNTKLPKDHFFY